VVWFVVLQYGRPIEFMLLTKHELRNRPESWVVPTPLTDLSVNRSPGEKFSYFGFAFESPWAGVKGQRGGRSIVILDFQNGGVISISRESSGLAVMKEEAAKERRDIRSIFGSCATESDYNLESAILYLTPQDLRLFSSRQEMMGNSILLTLKGIYTSAGKGGVYSFHTDQVKGFQVGSLGSDNHVTIDAFDQQDRKVRLLVGDEVHSKFKASQSDVNRILDTLQPDSAAAE
jgi:hypothetical protein